MKTIAVNDLDHKRLKRLSADSGQSIKNLVTESVDALKKELLFKDKKEKTT